MTATIDDVWGRVERALVTVESTLDINVPKVIQHKGQEQGLKMRAKLQSAQRELMAAKRLLVEMEIEGVCTDEPAGEENRSS